MPDCEIRYIGQRGDKFAILAEESAVVDGHWRILAGKFRRYYGVSKWVYVKDLRIMLRNFRDIFYFGIGFLQSTWILFRWRPDVIFVKGGYVGLPIGLAGALLHVPIVTHDSDTLPGLTNRILSRYAKFTAVAMPPKYYTKYEPSKIKYTGLPIRSEFVKVTKNLEISAKKTFGIPAEAQVLAVVGGSLGAIRLNNAVLSIAEELLGNNKNLHLLHVTGSEQYEDIDGFYKSLPENIADRILYWPFSNDVHLVTAAADIVVSRSGSSVHELSVQQKCVILVPNPVLTGGHQTVNAKVLAGQDAVVMISEKQLTETENSILLDEVNNLLTDEKRRQELSENLSKLAVGNAVEKIVDVILEAAKK